MDLPERAVEEAQVEEDSRPGVAVEEGRASLVGVELVGRLDDAAA